MAASLSLLPWTGLSPAQKAQVAALRIPDDQLPFAGRIETSIASCEAGPVHCVQGYAALADDVAIGFLLLKRWTSAPNWVAADAVIVAALRIDGAFQGRGWGAKILDALPAVALRTWPETRQLVLSVDDHNINGIKLYQRAGWHDDGSRHQGRIGIERRMALRLRLAQSCQA